MLDQFKEAAKDGRAHVLFVDESGMSNVPNVQRAWSPLAKPHCADASVAKKRVNLLGALDYGTNTLTHTVHEMTVKRTQVIAFIDQLAAQYADDKPKIVVLDNASIHHHFDDEKIRTWLCEHQLLLFYLPPYSPELNPIEIVWKQAKYHWRKFVTWTKEDLLDQVSELFRGYGEQFKICYA